MVTYVGLFYDAAEIDQQRRHEVRIGLSPGNEALRSLAIERLSNEDPSEATRSVLTSLP